ncbi:hypothetical protein JRQ81_019028 [Phrynocephalus forsythii]|uniref:Checkpoint protein n=1 Tax=Phrynocephalus forsythii TaxID=171643 RepID=A0A9Q0XSZ8_9SAUR|nr:hypothetical protein JRQ81_019028 [Phrynocephalus forsythii]
MRFRAKVVDVRCLSQFTRVINTVAKLAKTCMLRLTVDKLYFILSDKVANGGISMWCELNQGSFFDEFQMEGVATENNEIFLEVTSENLSRALKTAQNAKSVKIKLTNKQCPCLTVAVELPSLCSSSRIVTHDIPVGVIPRKLWNDFREPNVPEFDVSIYLPVMKTMKSVVERMKNLSNFIANVLSWQTTQGKQIAPTAFPGITRMPPAANGSPSHLIFRDLDQSSRQRERIDGSTRHKPSKEFLQDMPYSQSSKDCQWGNRHWCRHQRHNLLASFTPILRGPWAEPPRFHYLHCWHSLQDAAAIAIPITDHNTTER